jgi:hypothetical protein
MPTCGQRATGFLSSQNKLMNVQGAVLMRLETAKTRSLPVLIPPSSLRALLDPAQLPPMLNTSICAGKWLTRQAT